LIVDKSLYGWGVNAFSGDWWVMVIEPLLSDTFGDAVLLFFVVIANVWS